MIYRIRDFDMKRFPKVALAMSVIALYLFGLGNAQALRYVAGEGRNARGGGWDAATCLHRRFRPCQGCTVHVRLRTRENEICPFNLQSLGPIAGQQVLVHPRNGSFGAADQTSTAYRPKPGYLGKDYFETRIYFEQGNGKRTFMTLKVHVLVAPTLGF
jgi:hypothetical protein